MSLGSLGSFGSELYEWECVLIILECFFYLFGVRVTENSEVGYGALTTGITGGQSVKIQITGGYIELEANHRLVMCNYP